MPSTSHSPALNSSGKNLSIGTLPIDILVIVDTGSDLTWTQCEPCVDCFKQLAPIFNPKNSSSYKTIGCNNKICKMDFSHVRIIHVITKEFMMINLIP